MVKIADQWLRDILRVMFQARTVSRPEIIQATRLNPASVSHAIQRLLQSGTILKVGELQSDSGRRRDVLKLNGDAAYFLVIDLEGTRIRFACTNLVGDVRYRWEEDIELGRSLEVARIVHGAEMVLQRLNSWQRSRMIAMGISCPGFVDSAGRVTAINLGWQGVSLLERLQKAFELPIFLEQAHRTAILAERWLGLAQNCDNCVYVLAGHGIGASIFADGRLLCGRDQMAGELGHIIVEPDAQDRCNCGKRGCLEAIASSPNILRQYLEKIGRRANHLVGSRVVEVFDRARQKDSAAVQVLDRAGKALGIGLAFLTNLLNPELIILGGDIVTGEDLLLPRIRKELCRGVLPHFSEGLQLVCSSLGADIGLTGAASLAFRSSLLDAKLLKKLSSPAPEMFDREHQGISRASRHANARDRKALKGQ